MCYASQPLPVCQICYHHLAVWVCKGSVFIRNMQRLSYFMIERLKIDCVKIVADRIEVLYLLCFMTGKMALICIVFVLYSCVFVFRLRRVDLYRKEERS